MFLKDIIMNKWFYLSMLAIMTMVLMSVGFISCSSDDEEDSGSLSTPAYKDVSALYRVTDGNTLFTSFEFSESGNYVIVKRTGYKSREKSATRAAGLMVSPWYEEMTRSTSYSNIITGKYTKKGDNVYELEGFGTITVTSDSNGQYSLEIAESGETPYTLTAERKEQYAGSARTNKLCRTWRISNIRMQLKGTAHNGDKSYDMNIDENVNGGNLAELMYKFYVSTVNWAIKVSGENVPQSYLDSEFSSQKKEYERMYPVVETMMFTQTGTYMVTYANSTLAVATWTWYEDSDDKIRYSWNYSNMSSVISGDCSVEFKGNKCILAEEKTGSFDIVSGASVKTIYTLTEVK